MRKSLSVVGGVGIACIAGLAAFATPEHAGHGSAAVSSEPFVATSEVPFDKAMDDVMARMHAAMSAAKPTGDHDRDFLTMMIPHHQGAVDMAKVLLLHTKDPALRNLAQSIITEQTYEIELMAGMLKQPSTSKQSK